MRALHWTDKCNQTVALLQNGSSDAYVEKLMGTLMTKRNEASKRIFTSIYMGNK
ncbi:AAEL001741-PA [Aedes aegypti]|uniref:AAEL001741-PA n=1 Tax=Aedes aegypti TaxID=7159 RepID=Q17KB1_AEDAE|nr:AAEL001741-PA [Aedes aegypti]